MSSPAERYFPARRRAASSVLTDFAAGYGFPLDDFQAQACRALEAGEGVLVAAPTGAGKTVVGEFAVYLALRDGRKCFYTTPVKALSNQKYADLVARHGGAAVGLLTGDNTINGAAPVVVMTTEVLRNMLYGGSAALRGLGYVVMDEVHYLSDRFRGAVWEEVIIHLPESVRLVSLSATVSNTEEFADWLVTVRGPTTVIVEEHRPVRPRSRGSRGSGVPSRVEVIERLDAEGLLPAITFVFSRVGCDAAVAQCLRAGLRLNSPEERAAARELVEQRTAEIPAEDLRVLGYWEWRDGLERGIAAHHAGMLPTFKEVVEELFGRGLVKAVFATETLALGINMPARSVVLEKLVKWNGETHVELTAGEYTQLTGRAGRRGIDVEGHAVVLWTPGFDPEQVAGLASTRTYPLRSSFRPSYNMAVNLVGSMGREAARVLLESSFAQFQADRAVVGLGRQVTRNLAALAGYQQAMTCHLGDFAAYAEIRREIRARESALARKGAGSRRAAAAEALARLRIGDVIRVPAGRRHGLAVVLDPGVSAAGEAHPLVLTAERWAGRLSATDFPTAVEPLGRVKVPRHFNHRSPQARRDLAAALRISGVGAEAGRPGRARSLAAEDDELAQLRAALRRHSCHSCAERDDHARWAERYDRLRRDTDALERRVQSKTNTIARTFDRVCAVLDDLGYLSGDTVTPLGQQLARVYSEADLLVVECLSRRLWDELSAAELAACVSALVYEARRPDDVAAKVPAGRVRDALAGMVRAWAALDEAESAHGLSFLREPDVGFAWAAFRWASGASLDAVLSESAEGTDLSAGDFVRWTKQLLDLLAQVALVAPADRSVPSADSLSTASREAPE